RERVQIEQAIVGGGGIHFEIAGVDYHTERGMNRQRDAIDQAVGDGNGMNREGADFEAVAGANFAQVGFLQQAVLVEFVFDIRQREFRAPDRHFQLGKHPGQGADVVLVAVRENNRAYPLTILDQIRNVRNDDVDAEQLGFGEHHARVDDNDVIAPAYGHAVHAEFAEAAQ